MDALSTQVNEVARALRLSTMNKHNVDRTKLVRICTGLGLKDAWALVRGLKPYFKSYSDEAPSSLITMPLTAYQQLIDTVDKANKAANDVSSTDDVRALRASANASIDIINHLQLGDNYG